MQDGDGLLTISPDIIAVRDAETGEPITIEGLCYGSRVAVVALPCHVRWRGDASLRLAGPDCVGYDIAHLPSEERVSA